jgi:hypothetical protein
MWGRKKGCFCTLRAYTRSVASPPSAAAGALRFGVFEIDLSSGELRRNGSLVRLAP